MKKENKKIKMSYGPEADILRIETGRAPIDYATEMGNAVVHFTKKGVPVYFEILDATRFLKNASRILAPHGKKVLTPALNY